MLEGSLYNLYVCPVLAPPSSSYFQSLTVLQKVTGEKKNLTRVCVRACAQQVVFLFGETLSSTRQKEGKDNLR